MFVPLSSYITKRELPKAVRPLSRWSRLCLLRNGSKLSTLQKRRRASMEDHVLPLTLVFPSVGHVTTPAANL